MQQVEQNTNWQKTELKRTLVNGEQVLQFDYTNLNPHNNIRRISLLKFSNPDFQFGIDDNSGKILEDNRFRASIMGTLFNNPISYRCYSERIDKVDELYSLIDSIERYTDISDIKIDLYLMINPDLTESEIFSFLKNYEEKNDFDAVLNSVRTIKMEASKMQASSDDSNEENSNTENAYLDQILDNFAQNYLDKGQLSKALAIYEIILTRDLLVEKAQELRNGIQDGSFMSFGDSSESAEQFEKHLERVINSKQQGSEETDYFECGTELKPH